MSATDEDGGSPLDELAAAIAAGAVRLAAATASWLRLVAEFDARGGWHGIGIRSCAEWLAWQCGLAPGAAREHVRVARALVGLPLIRAAFAGGRLSYSKVRALTRIAAPDCEAALLEFARSATASQTERFCRQWRRIDDRESDPAREIRPSFEYTTDDEGFFTLKVRGRVEDGEPMMAAIDSLAERNARRERAQNTRAPAAHGQLVAAAGGVVDTDLVERCEDEAVGLAQERTAARRIAALTSLAEARVGMDRRPGDPPRREVVVHVDAAVLADDTAAGRAHYEGGAALSAARARRLLCEATVVAMIENGREPLAVGRRRRRATAAQRRALLRRDGGCARPGCPETRIERLHAHHLRHWLYGGRTDVNNLVLLCDTDHGLVHDNDLVMSRRNGHLVVIDPDGRRVWGTADAAFAGGLAGLHADATTDDAFAGVHPMDNEIARRPVGASDDPDAPTAGEQAASTTPRLRERPGTSHREDSRRPAPSHDSSVRPPGRGRCGRSERRSRRGAASSPGLLARQSSRIDRVLFPSGSPPDLPVTVQERYDRLDMAYAIGVLMANRDLTRRLADEAGIPPIHVPAGTSASGRV